MAELADQLVQADAPLDDDLLPVEGDGAVGVWPGDRGVVEGLLGDVAHA